MLEWQFWLILGIVFVIFEIITPTFFFFWFGLSAFITSIISIIISNKIITTTIFILISIILWLFSRKIVKKWQKPIDNRKFHLDNLIGKEGIAIIDFDENNSGIVKILGEEWKAYSKEGKIKKGDKVVILKRQSNILIVGKIT